jgi:hypothetical protein
MFFTLYALFFFVIKNVFVIMGLASILRRIEGIISGVRSVFRTADA